MDNPDELWRLWLIRIAIWVVGSYCVFKGAAGLILGHAFIYFRRGRSTEFDGSNAFVFSAFVLVAGLLLLSLRSRIEEEL